MLNPNDKGHFKRYTAATTPAAALRGQNASETGKTAAVGHTMDYFINRHITLSKRRHRVVINMVAGEPTAAHYYFPFLRREGEYALPIPDTTALQLLGDGDEKEGIPGWKLDSTVWGIARTTVVEHEFKSDKR